MTELDVESLLEAHVKANPSLSQTPSQSPPSSQGQRSVSPQLENGGSSQVEQSSSSSNIKDNSSGLPHSEHQREGREYDRDRLDRDRRDRDRHYDDRDGHHRSSRHSRKRSRSRSHSRDRHRRRHRRSRSHDRDYYERRNRDRDYYGGHRDKRHRSRSRERDHQRHEEEKKEEPVLTEEEQRLRDEKTAFISNLPIKATKEDLIEFFDPKCGGVVDVRLITDKFTRKSKGVAYIEFKTKDGMQLAMSLPDKRIMGQTFFVQPTFAEKNIIAAARQKQIQMMQQQAQNVGLHAPVSTLNPLQRVSALMSGGTRLVATQLHELTTDTDLIKIFSAVGETPIVDIQYDDQGRSKGYAFIKYTKVESARKALMKFDGLEIAGRKMRVREMRDDVNTVGELDDDEGNIKTKMDQKARVNLMHKLQKPGTEIEIPGMSNPLPKILVPRHTTAIKILNSFDPSEETSPNWEKELRDDFVDECTNKFGPVETCLIDKNNKLVYIRFFEVQHAQHAIQVLHGRWFGGRQLIVEFIDEKDIPKA